MKDIGDAHGASQEMSTMVNRLVMTFGAILLAAGAACSTSSRDTNEAAGEVVLRARNDARNDSSGARPAVRWLTDANLLSLFNMMNARQIAAADVELEAWHVDSVRAFAASVAREHAELQHSVDSLSERLHLTPIAPALAQTISATLQSQLDTLRRTYGRALDRAFVRQQVATYQLMTDYMTEFAAVAERAEMQSLFTAAKDSMSAQLSRARTLQAALALADSVAADSAAKVAARRARRAAARP
jgi:predicted outer membrane protein